MRKALFPLYILGVGSMRQEGRIKIRENMQVNEIYGIIHEKFSYGFSNQIYIYKIFKPIVR